MKMTRTAKLVEERPKSQVSLYMLTAGSVSAVYDGAERHHLPGDIVAIDYSRPYESTTFGFEGIAITFDKTRAPPGFQSDVHGMVILAGSAPGAFLGGQIRSLIELADRLDVNQAQSAVDCVIRFAESVFAPGFFGGKRDDTAIFESAVRHALRKMSDPDFTPDALAVALNVSRSKLFRAFRKYGGVQRWLLRERLAASLQAIARSAGRPKISTIAHQHGFRSEAHFSRAFQKRYQISPSSARDLATSVEGATLYLDWLESRGGDTNSIVEAWLTAARR